MIFSSSAAVLDIELPLSLLPPPPFSLSRSLFVSGAVRMRTKERAIGC